SIIDTETVGDLRVGHIQSTGSCTSPTPCSSAVAAGWLFDPIKLSSMGPLGDVTLNSPAAILDAESDSGVRATDPDDTISGGVVTTFGADAQARNTTMTAGNNRLGLGSSDKSGRGGVGTPGDFLEIYVNADGLPLGVVTVEDTASART